MLFGDVGAGGIAALMKVVYFDSSRSIVIVRVSRDFFRHVIFAMSCATHIKGIAVMMRTLRVSSTGRTCVKGLQAMFSSRKDDSNEIDFKMIQSSL